MKKLVPMLLLLVIYSCGKSDSGSETQVINNIENEEVAMEEGEYVAFLRTINSSVNGFIPFGRAQLALKEDELNITTYLDDDQRVLHIQNIYAGSRCPTIKDDINKDGIVDIQEANAVLGKMILPLDGDISSIKAGEGQFPTGPSFTYNKKAKWSDILENLQKHSDESYFQLKGEHFTLANRVILIQGTSSSGKIPETVATLDNRERHVSVPIACGVIKPKLSYQ